MLLRRASKNDPKRIRNWCGILFALGCLTMLAGPSNIFGIILLFTMLLGLMRALYLAVRWNERIIREWESRAYEPYS